MSGADDCESVVIVHRWVINRLNTTPISRRNEVRWLLCGGKGF